MFEYKNETFYNKYFSHLNDFKLVNKFKKTENKDNNYVGLITTVNTVYPVEIMVEIPTTFPHSKLTLSTKSISGQPHLIPYKSSKRSSWFCLNTPFAETPEEQLNQEISRLRGFIKRYIREDLPPKITDSKMRKALFIANAYSWENYDEINEVSEKSLLYFVDDGFFQDPSNFKEKKGVFYCQEGEDDQFFVFRNKELSAVEIPYVIENSINSGKLNSFSEIKKQYCWDEDTCKLLLGSDFYSEEWEPKTSTSISFDKNQSFTAYLNRLSQIEQEWVKGATIRVVVQLQEEVDDCISSLEDVDTYGVSRNIIITEKMYDYFQKMATGLRNTAKQEKDLDKKTSSWSIACYAEGKDPGKELRSLFQVPEIDYFEAERYNSKRNYFLFGVIDENKINWKLVYTIKGTFKAESFCVDFLDSQLFAFSRIIDRPLFTETPQYISVYDFFGRGKFSTKLSERKICIVGVGAIGSMVAESLVRSGVSVLGLFDDDIVEPGNICRSTYTLKDIGKSKVEALKKKLLLINPYIDSSIIRANYAFYGKVNYSSQEKALKKLEAFDLIIDCTGSNEMLHLLSYSLTQKDLISMCITNHSNDLLCITNRDGNAFELRKSYLAKIEQDTKNFFIERTGCYSPTFLATKSDIDALVNLAVRELNKEAEQGNFMHSVIFSHDKRGVVADRIKTYRLEDYDIVLNISTETLMDGEDISDKVDGTLGYVFGAYSRDGKQIILTHFADADNALENLSEVFGISNGIIDYIGDYVYSTEESGSYDVAYIEQISAKSKDAGVNTNNPMLVLRNPDRSLSFYLYINGELKRFIETEG